MKMVLPWFSALLLATLLVIVTSDYNPAVCDVIKESCGLAPPVLPTDFEVRREHVDHSQMYAIYEELFFDFTNTRAKYMFLLRGIEHHFLFDYKVQQVVNYDILHPGGDVKQDPMSHFCKATELEDSDYKDYFGYIEDDSGRGGKMYNSYQALKYGGQYRYAFNGTDRMLNRGLLVDKFIGCLYDESMDSTINATYLFTSKLNMGVGTPAGNYEENITGIENGLLSVPAKADIFGTVYDEDTNTHLPLNKSFSYFWFNGKPEFKMGTFQLPPYLYCSNYRGRKVMPKFPVAFDTRLQKTTLKRSMLGKLEASEVTSYETVYYYKEKNLARKDYIPGPDDQDTEVFNKFNNYSPVRTVYDFNQGLLYVTNVPSGRCYIRPINHGDFFETSKNIMIVSMGTPEEIFQMETDDMEYKGKDFTRDIECDVWAGKYYDKELNATYVKETYISTNGWHEDVDGKVEYGVPVKHTIIQKDLDGEMTEGVIAYSFLKFITTTPELSFFDVSNCIETENYQEYAIFLTISDETKNQLFEYKSQFLETAQYYITEVTQVMSPLRVQRLQFLHLALSDTRPVVIFTLVDKIKLKTKIPFGQKGATLLEAAANLQKFIDLNQFAIKFYPPKAKEMTLVPALKGSLYIKTSTGDLSYFTPVRSKLTLSTVGETPQWRIMFDNPQDIEDEENKGMTPGALSLLALAMLFIGVGIGVAVMYLYLRQQSESKMDDRIHLSMQTSVEVKEETTTTENAQ